MRFYRQAATLSEQDDLVARPARSREELKSAYARVYWSYRRRAYIEAAPSQMELSIFNAFPQTVTFVSLLRGQIIASLTLIPDTEIGLPMDEDWAGELGKLRRRGRDVAEATMFADRRHRDFRRVIPMLLLLMKRLFDYAALVEGVDDICIEVTPRHGGFYERFLQFRHLCPRGSANPDREERGVPMRLPLDELPDIAEDREDLRRHFLQNRTPLEVLEDRHHMDCADLRYFFVDCTNVFAEATTEAMQALKDHYPECPWDGWLKQPKGG